MSTQTIDVNAMEWFDKQNGNSYFSARVILDYGTENERTIKLPFQYGYGEHYQDVALDAILEAEGTGPYGGALWSYCRSHGIILRTSKQENCLQRDVKSFATT